MPDAPLSASHRLFSALRHRNFRYFWTGQCVSLIGTWMQNVSQDWLVVQLTNSSWKLGLLVAAKTAPMMILPPFAGVVAERYRKRNIILLTQALLMIQAVILAVLTGTGIVRYEHVLILVFGWGLVNSFDMPARQSYVIELAGREDVMNAVALNSTIVNTARLIGPTMAGLALNLFGMTACFALNAASFLAVIGGLLLIPPGQRGEGQGQRRIIKEIVEGVRYTWQNQPLRDPLILLTILSIFSINFTVLIPAYAKFTLHGGPRTMGYLWSALGAGALGAALNLAGLSHKGPRRWFIIAAGAGLCLGQLGVAAVRALPPAIPFFVFAGLSMTSFTASVNSTLQIQSDDAHRGRVMGLFSLVFVGLTPFGSLFSGSVAQWAGPPAAFIAGSVISLIGVGLMALRWHASTYPISEQNLTVRGLK